MPGFYDERLRYDFKLQINTFIYANIRNFLSKSSEGAGCDFSLIAGQQTPNRLKDAIFITTREKKLHDIWWD